MPDEAHEPGSFTARGPRARATRAPSEQEQNATPDARPLRLFVAIELPDQWRDALRDQSRALEQASPGFARWVAPELIHLTLVFLGSQQSSLVARIEAAVDEAAASTEPLTLGPGELGSFGGARSLRVIWAGISEKPPGALGALHGRLTGSLQQAGIAFDPGSFRPHLTLGRAKRDRSEGSETMFRAIRAGSSGAFKRLSTHTCGEMVLIHSDLRPTGPIYTPLHRAAFSAR